MHTNIQGHWPFGSREEDFFRFLPYMAMAATLVMWPGPLEQTFVPPSHKSSIWNLTLIGPVVSEEKMFKECGRRQRTTEAYLSYKLTIWAFGSGELKTAHPSPTCCKHRRPLPYYMSRSRTPRHWKHRLWCQKGSLFGRFIMKILSVYEKLKSQLMRFMVLIT